jgi:dTDP-L-rhamnose 4-epimerase
VLEDGNQRRDFVHVTDVARANVKALEAVPEKGTLTPLNICSGTPHTVGELATELAKACNGPAPKVVGGTRPGDVRHVVADPSAAREKLGFTAKVTFEQGIADFATAPLRAPASHG